MEGVFSMTVINTNVSSLNAQAALATNQRGLSKAMEQLSTGRRINSAGDDAAGLAIAAKMTSQIRGLNQAVRNANDGISMLQTAEGATNEITNMLQRMRELAVQAANDTYSSDDRTALNSEFVALRTEIARVAATTQWNGMEVLNGTGPGTSGVVKFQIGASGASSNASNELTFTFADLTTGASGAMMSISAAAITSQTLASAAIGLATTTIATINAKRSDMGAVINRLQYTVDNLTNISTNAAASRSRIEDADYSTVTTDLAKRQIIQQAATAMLSQANQQPQVVLSLLK
ncbi:flagellin [Rhizobiales bacterium TNE-4]|nr:flagellin [Rhizobiales bacterium TNE-4]MBV1828616.1 flagellin [Rhizobiales bacterium TNE-4]